MDVLENYEKDTLRIGVKIADTSTRAIAAGVLWLLLKLKEQIFDKESKGLVPMKKLAKEGYALDDQLVKDANLKELSKIMKKYHVGFSAMQQGDSGNYVLFFKAKDHAQIQAALNDYLAKAFAKEAPGVPLPEKASEREAVFIQTFLALPPGKDNLVLPMPDAVPLLKEPEKPLTIGTDPRSPVPIDVSFTAIEEPKKSLDIPKPRSIPKALEKAKNEAKILEQAREAMREKTRQRLPKREKSR